MTLPAGWKQAGPVKMQKASHDSRDSACPVTHLRELLGVEFSDTSRCLLGAVRADGPAGRCGLRPGDSIVGCNGRAVTCPSALDPLLLTSSQPKIKLLVSRAISCKDSATSPAKQ